MIASLYWRSLTFIASSKGYIFNLGGLEALAWMFEKKKKIEHLLNTIMFLLTSDRFSRNDFNLQKRSQIGLFDIVFNKFSWIILIKNYSTAVLRTLCLLNN